MGKPRFRVVKEDPPLIATNQVIMAIGSRRYALDVSIRCTELKPSPAEVIPIEEHFKKGQRKSHYGQLNHISNAD
jgi:hypothetical protein